MSTHFSGTAGGEALEDPTTVFPLSFWEIFELKAGGGDILPGYKKKRKINK
jgi:hypothetical protein